MNIAKRKIQNKTLQDLKDYETYYRGEEEPFYYKSIYHTSQSLNFQYLNLGLDRISIPTDLFNTISVFTLLYCIIRLLHYLYIALSLYCFIYLMIYPFIALSLYCFISWLLYLFFILSLYSNISLFQYLFIPISPNSNISVFQYI